MAIFAAYYDWPSRGRLRLLRQNTRDQGTAAQKLRQQSVRLANLHTKWANNFADRIA